MITLSELLFPLNKAGFRNGYSAKTDYIVDLGVLICLVDLDKYLDEDKSRPKNLDPEKKVNLDVMDNLDTSKKLVLTRRTFSISIGLNCRDHQGYYIVLNGDHC